MTVLASRFAYDDYEEDLRSDLDSKYEEGFGQGPDLGDDEEDDFDDLFAGLFDAEDDDEDEPSPEPKRAAAKRTSVRKSTRNTAGTPGKRTTAGSPVVTRTATPVTAASGAAAAGLAAETFATAPGMAPVAAAPVVTGPVESEPAASGFAPARPEPGSAALLALAEAATRARVAAESAAKAAKRAVTDAVAKAAAAKAAAAQASAAEEAAQAALARSAEADEAARVAAERLVRARTDPERTDAATAAEATGQDHAGQDQAGQELAGHQSAEPGGPTGSEEDAFGRSLAEPAALDAGQPAASGTPELDVSEPAAPEASLAEASEEAEETAAVVRSVAPVTDPLFAPAIAPVSEHVDFLRKLRPGLDVPYVDPMHSAEECRIVSLFSNTGAENPRGFVWAGDDAAATRLLGLQYQLGLRPEWIMPWNVYPWFTPGEANGKLDPEQVQAGLKPLLALLKLLPRASAIVAHGPEANRLAQQLLKTGNPLIWRRGLKVYKARSLHGRAFAGSKERQTEWLIEMGKSYADAMARAGVQLRRA